MPIALAPCLPPHHPQLLDATRNPYHAPFALKIQNPPNNAGKIRKVMQGVLLEKNSQFFPGASMKNHWEILQKRSKKPVKITQKNRDF